MPPLRGSRISSAQFGSKLTAEALSEAYGHSAWAAWYMDAVGPTFAMATGLRVWPWSASSMRLVVKGSEAVERGKFLNENVASYTTRFLPQV